MEIYGEDEHHWDIIDDHLKDGNLLHKSGTIVAGVVTPEFTNDVTPKINWYSKNNIDMSSMISHKIRIDQNERELEPMKNGWFPTPGFIFGQTIAWNKIKSIDFFENIWPALNSGKIEKKKNL